MPRQPVWLDRKYGWIVVRRPGRFRHVLGGHPLDFEVPVARASDLTQTYWAHLQDIIEVSPLEALAYETK